MPLQIILRADCIKTSFQLTEQRLFGVTLGGVRVGLLLVGEEVAAASIITWGGTNAEGQFELEKPVPPGRYNLRAKVVGYDLYSIDFDLSSANQPITIELKPTSRD